MNILQKPKHQFIFFLLLFFIINFIQILFSEVLEDEAYYWMWSQQMAFGYFDHPPLVAVWIKISSIFFDGEMGVRFFSTLSFTLMLVIIWKMIDLKNKNDYVWLYFILIISMAMLNIYGFITTPDTPLLLFTAVFLYFYQRFLKEESWLYTFGLGFAMAGMLYAKYHGSLVILFTVLSNLKLLKNKRFWIAGGFGFLLFFPHLYWQYLNDFPSFRYHLIERGAKKYKFEYTLLHFVNQIAIVGITFPLIYYAFFKEKAKNVFEKALKYIVYGFFTVFFFSTFKSQPQAQWTIIILIPLIIFSFRFFVSHPALRKKLVYVALIQFAILLTARVFFASEKLSPVKLEPHLAKTWVYTLEEKTDQKPLVFLNYAYRSASVYYFYTGIKTHVYSILQGRKSQYDIDDSEAYMQHKDVYAVSDVVNGPFLVMKGDKKLNGKAIANFQTFQKIRCTLPDKELAITPGKEVKISFEMFNTYKKGITFENVEILGVFQKKKKVLKEIPLRFNDLRSMDAGEKRILNTSFTAPEIDYDKETTFRISLRFYDLGDGFQGNKVKVKIID
jgi:hypothetical protein